MAWFRKRPAAGLLPHSGRGVQCVTPADRKAASFEPIEVFYHRKRQHSTLGCLSPIQFLEHWVSQQHPEKLVA